MRAARSFEVHPRRRSSFARGVCEAMGLPLGFPEGLRPAFARSVMWFDFADAHYEHNTQKEKGRPGGAALGNRAGVPYSSSRNR
jgi:hypothetical protein